MIGRIRQHMRTAFAKPPTLRRPAARFAPEFAAAATYLVLFVAAGILGGTAQRPFLAGAAWAYMVAGVILVGVPTGLAALAWSGERSAGTLEGLVLLPGDRDSLVWGRYWHLVVPWLRYTLWILPVYLMCVVRFGPGTQAGYDRSALDSAFCVFAPRPMLAGMLIVETRQTIGLIGDAHLIILALRLGRDVLSLMLAVSLAYYISASVRRPVVAVGLALIAVPLLLSTLFSGAEWMTWILEHLTKAGRPPGELPALYFFWSVITVGLELFIAFRLVRSLARRFDRFALADAQAEAA